MLKDLLEIVLSKIYIHNSESIELSNFEGKKILQTAQGKLLKIYSLKCFLVTHFIHKGTLPNLALLVTGAQSRAVFPHEIVGISHRKYPNLIGNVDIYN